ncbi:MAG: hypothetical protein ACLRSD_13665 [Oscillibacter sp.]
MKRKHILKWLGIALGAYLFYAVLTAVFVPLPQKEAAGELWSQYEARLSTDASQERVRSIEDTDSALLWRLQLIEMRKGRPSSRPLTCARTAADRI